MKRSFFPFACVALFLMLIVAALTQSAQHTNTQHQQEPRHTPQAHDKPKHDQEPATVAVRNYKCKVCSTSGDRRVCYFYPCEWPPSQEQSLPHTPPQTDSTTSLSEDVIGDLAPILRKQHFHEGLNPLNMTSDGPQLSVRVEKGKMVDWAGTNLNKDAKIKCWVCIGTSDGAETCVAYPCADITIKNVK
jgi:hypothetical protein